jgi:hypothetical protein
MNLFRLINLNKFKKNINKKFVCLFCFFAIGNVFFGNFEKSLVALMTMNDPYWKFLPTTSDKLKYFFHEEHSQFTLKHI